MYGCNKKALYVQLRSQPPLSTATCTIGNTNANAELCRLTMYYQLLLTTLALTWCPCIRSIFRNAYVEHTPISLGGAHQSTDTHRSGTNPIYIGWTSEPQCAYPLLDTQDSTSTTWLDKTTDRIWSECHGQKVNIMVHNRWDYTVFGTVFNFFY